ncbi:MAG: CsbD family protein [Gemmatimonadaceae bacterium]|nr:CsbD family protein [Gemmatimonadaceae bacterium]
MNTDKAKGTWLQVKGKLREKWGKLTDDELDQMEGKWEQVSGLIQQRYGEAKEKVEEELTRFRSGLDDSMADRQTPPPRPL